MRKEEKFFSLSAVILVRVVRNLSAGKDVTQFDWRAARLGGAFLCRQAHSAWFYSNQKTKRD